jgi:hypothetical protein
VSVNGTPVETKLCTFTLESTHLIFNKCPIYPHDGASAKFSTNSQETDYSACSKNAGETSIVLWITARANRDLNKQDSVLHEAAQNFEVFSNIQE